MAFVAIIFREIFVIFCCVTVIIFHKTFFGIFYWLFLIFHVLYVLAIGFNNCTYFTILCTLSDCTSLPQMPAAVTRATGTGRQRWLPAFNGSGAGGPWADSGGLRLVPGSERPGPTVRPRQGFQLQVQVELSCSNLKFPEVQGFGVARRKPERPTVTNSPPGGERRAESDRAIGTQSRSPARGCRVRCPAGDTVSECPFCLGGGRGIAA